MKNNRIKELREKEGLTLIQLAASVGISYTTLSKYESGVVETGKLKTWKNIAKHFGVPISDLMGVDNVNKLKSDMVKVGNIIENNMDANLNTQLKRIESSDLSVDDKLRLSKIIGLTMDIQKDYSKSDEQLVADFDSVIDFMFTLSSTKDATDDDNRLEENDWFEELKQENIKKFDKLITTLYNNQIKAQNKKSPRG